MGWLIGNLETSLHFPLIVVFRYPRTGVHVLLL